MRRYLVVANQTLQAAELRDELGTKIGAGPCSVFVLVPDTKAADYDAVAVCGVLPQPGMWWWGDAVRPPCHPPERLECGAPFVRRLPSTMPETRGRMESAS